MDNPLVSTIKSTSGLQVVLHPLVLLAVSDYITRHTIRSQSGPIACGLIGQTHGREITIEHAFECQTTQISKENGDIILSADWFSSRLEQSIKPFFHASYRPIWPLSLQKRLSANFSRMM